MAAPRDTAGGASTDATTLAFLALYLIVLAFFLMLTAIATPSAERARAAVGSLATTFRGIAEVDIGARPESGGDALAGRFGVFAQGLRRLIETALPLALVVPDHLGREMRLAMAADALFMPDSADLRAEVRPVVERLAGLLAAPRSGEAVATEVLITAARGPGRALAIARAAGLVETLVGMGAPAVGLSAGIVPGASGRLNLVFRIAPSGPREAASP